MTLGQKLKKLRTEKGLTQKELADRLHVTFQTVSKWENDENEPDISTLKELAKLYDCSVDYLISEDEEEIVEETPVEDPTPVEPTSTEPAPEPVVKTIVIHTKELHVCERCHKDIPEDDLAMEDICVRPAGRGRSAEYRKAYYHKKCLTFTKNDRATVEQRERERKMARAKKLSFGLGIAGGVIALIIALLVFLLVPECKAALNPFAAIILSVVIGYAIFADLYCILSGSYIGDVFSSVSGWSIRLPGLIFSWSLEGFAWLIAMKILFMIIGFLFGLFVIIVAVSISAALSAISFPFVLIHNIRTNYADALD